MPAVPGHNKAGEPALGMTGRLYKQPRLPAAQTVNLQLVHHGPDLDAADVLDNMYINE